MDDPQKSVSYRAPAELPPGCTQDPMQPLANQSGPCRKRSQPDRAMTKSIHIHLVSAMRPPEKQKLGRMGSQQQMASPPPVGSPPPHESPRPLQHMGSPPPLGSPSPMATPPPFGQMQYTGSPQPLGPPPPMGLPQPKESPPHKELPPPGDRRLWDRCGPTPMGPPETNDRGAPHRDRGPQHLWSWGRSGRFGVRMRSSWDRRRCYTWRRSGDDLKSTWGVDPGSSWGRHGLDPGSIWDRFEVALGSIRGRVRVDMCSMWRRHRG